jgi:hypothetical protein
MAIEDLIRQNVMRTNDGRLFLPFSRTASYAVAPSDPGFTNYDEYFWNFDPVQGPGVIGSGRQDAFALSGIDASNRGTYNGELGYFFKPENLYGSHPATTMGQKGTESGLTQFLTSALGMYLGGALGGEAGSAGSAASEAGGSSIGESVGSGFSQGMGAEAGSSLGSTAGTAGATAAGGTTDNYFGDYLTDPNTGDVYSSDPYGTGVDQYGNPTGQYSDSTFTGDTSNTGYDYNSDPNYAQLAQKYGPKIAKALLGGSGGGGVLGRQTLGQSILGQLGSDPLSAGFSALPFILALTEANRQGGDINATIGRMRSLEDSVSGNASPYMNAVLNPYDQQTGTGRAALLQDQQLRGIRGSSFGDQSLNSYDYTRDLGRGDIASKALLGSAGLQGNLLGSELGAINARNTTRNLLLGAGLSASGRLFQPEKDPFNLNTLLGLS